MTVQGNTPTSAGKLKAKGFLASILKGYANYKGLPGAQKSGSGEGVTVEEDMMESTGNPADYVYMDREDGNPDYGISADMVCMEISIHVYPLPRPTHTHLLMYYCFSPHIITAT
jgi:hypothetical protein